MFYLLPTLATSHTVTLPELLFSRECRQSRQAEWLARHTSTLISFTVVAPGPIKDSVMTRKIFNHGLKALCQRVEQLGWELKEQASLRWRPALKGCSSSTHRHAWLKKP